jgi:hypothetical protein
MLADEQGDSALNTPKKPGTDLAALKARLAKKTKDEEAAAAPPAEAAPVEAAPAADHGHAPAQHYDPPAAFEAPAAPSFSPAAEVPHHAPAAPSFSAPAAPSDDPFGGPTNASFDPGPDIGGEIPGRSNVGVIAFSGIVFLAIGLGAGWLGHKIVSGNERLDAAKAKGDEMYKEVEKVSEARKSLALKWEELKPQIAMDPAAGSKAIVALMGETFEKSPQLDALFGWQLAAIHSSGIKKVFELYEKTTRVRIELAALAGYLQENESTLKGTGGPVSFGVKFTAEGAQLVALTGALCGENLTDLSKLTNCEDPGKAIAFKVQESLGAEEKTLAKGTGPDQVVFLPPTGNVFAYAIGQEPKKNSANVRDFMMKRIEETTDEMAKAEKTALKALENYASNPNVDGSNEQPDPGE